MLGSCQSFLKGFGKTFVHKSFPISSLPLFSFLFFFYHFSRMFLDIANVLIQSGHGGKGCVSFLREKFYPRGGPNGGDGGSGGSIYFMGDTSLNTLSKFRHFPKLVAPDGQPGRGSNCTGKSGKILKIIVPCGTIIKNAETGELLFEILKPGVPVLVARGGDGGRGNQHFASSTQQAPRRFERGWPGVKFKAILELKSIADVGLVGLPNAGKSSLIKAVSHATPKVADYAFTTLNPNLGVIDLPDYRNLVMADIPGIIEGASHGKGLGIQFLKHVERTRVLLFVLDISEYAPIPPWEAYKILKQEIHEFGQDLEKKKMLIAANKMDIDPERKALKKFLSKILKSEREKVFPISTVTQEGLKELVVALDKLSKTQMDE